MLALCWPDYAMCLYGFFLVIINGNPSTQFNPKRGLRQGDPLSPFLFFFCAEVLSSLIYKAEKSDLIHGAKLSRGGPATSHLFFADESILFGRAREEEIRVIRDILGLYSEASGQRISLEKSEVAFSSNVTEDPLNIWGSQRWWECQKRRSSDSLWKGSPRKRRTGNRGSYLRQGGLCLLKRLHKPFQVISWIVFFFCKLPFTKLTKLLQGFYGGRRQKNDGFTGSHGENLASKKKGVLDSGILKVSIKLSSPNNVGDWSNIRTPTWQNFFEADITPDQTLWKQNLDTVLALFGEALQRERNFWQKDYFGKLEVGELLEYGRTHGFPEIQKLTPPHQFPCFAGTI